MITKAEIVKWIDGEIETLEFHNAKFGGNKFRDIDLTMLTAIRSLIESSYSPEDVRRLVTVVNLHCVDLKNTADILGAWEWEGKKYFTSTAEETRTAIRELTEALRPFQQSGDSGELKGKGEKE